ncbi:MAG: hypothetical protein QM763_01625 [Agriterribacter sp.]
MRAILTLFTIIVFLSCKRGDIDPTPDPEPNLEDNVYATGKEGNPATACYWKGAQLIKLHTSNNSKITSEGKAIWVSGNDVFVAGEKLNDDLTEGVYWKNQTELPLESGSDQAFISDLFVSSGDVYIAGSVSDGNDHKAAYWKNGKIVILSTNGIYTDAHGIAIDSNDVYVAGFEMGRTYKAILWKNGIRQDLSGGNNSIAHDVEVSNNNVYIAGEVWNSVRNECDPVYWLNGALNSINHDEMYGRCPNLAIDGNDVYFPLTIWTEYESKIAAYWKNGVVSKLGEPAITNWSTSVKVNNGDVYLSGLTGPSSTQYKAVYWKNGVKVVLPATGPVSSATGIFIK